MGVNLLSKSKIAKRSQFTVKPRLFKRFEPLFGGIRAQAVAEDGVHTGDLTGIDVASDLEGVLAEGVGDVFAARGVPALQQFKGVLAIFGVRVAAHAPGVKEEYGHKVTPDPSVDRKPKRGGELSGKTLVHLRGFLVESGDPRPVARADRGDVAEPVVFVRLGHSSVRVTAEICSDMLHGQDDEAALRWDQFRERNAPQKQEGDVQ